MPEKKALITLDDYDYNAKGVRLVNAIEWLLGKKTAFLKILQKDFRFAVAFSIL